MKYQQIDIHVDSAGRLQTNDQRIARITAMFQSGLVYPEKAQEAIRKLARGENVTLIETTRLEVRPLDAVMGENQLTREREEREAEEAAAQEREAVITKEQGIQPVRRPTL